MRTLLAALLLALAATTHAQTVIDLNRGARLRAKTLDDYRNVPLPNTRGETADASYSDHLRRAFSALRTDSLDEAERHFREALDLKPAAEGNYVIDLYLAQIEAARGRYDKAYVQLSEIVKAHPRYCDARAERGEAALRLGRAAEAEEDASWLITPPETVEVPDDLADRARFIRAAARYQLRRYPEARADLHELLLARPDDVDGKLLDALALLRMGQRQEALNRLNVAVEAHPDDDAPLATRASVLAELGSDALACADYDTLIQRHPDNADLYPERAKILLRLGRKQAARRDLDTAVRLGTRRGTLQPLYNLAR